MSSTESFADPRPPLGLVLNSASSHSSASVATNLACLALFLLVNPFLAVFILALISVFRPVSTSIFIASASISFSLIFYFRDYGIDWYFNSSDDVANYRYIYSTFQDLTFQDLIANFIDAPNGNELFWHLPWWGLMRIFGASEETFVYLHYLLIFFSIFLALLTFSKRHLIAFVVVYFFLTPISIDSIAHIWRQQLAFSMFLAGVGLYLVKGRRSGRWLIYLSPLMHVSLVFFLFGFFVFQAIRKSKGFNDKWKFSLALVALMIVVPILSSRAVNYLDLIGLARIMSFFEGHGTDVVRVYMILGLYMTSMLACFYLLKHDDANNLFVVLCFSVFSIVAALPEANGIYDRLLMFVLPLLGIYFFRSVLANFSVRWQIPVLTCSFIVGAVRLYMPTLDQSGPMYFLAFGHALDPAMGILRMLVSF
jgi:EpsG family